MLALKSLCNTNTNTGRDGAYPFFPSIFNVISKVLYSLHRGYLPLVLNESVTESYGIGQGTAFRVSRRHYAIHKNKNIFPSSCTVCHVTASTEIEKQQES